jgi:DedD protein
MNQELKQRLIGAIVVTALAAIFVPMLFDDPIDNSGQSITALNIPETPVMTGETSANKLPTSANQVLNTPDTASETEVNTNEEAELSTSISSPEEKTVVRNGNVPNTITKKPQFDEPIDNDSSNALDTGVVDENNKPLKQKKYKVQADPNNVSAPFDDAAINQTPPARPLRKSQLDSIKHAPKEGISLDADKAVVTPAKSKAEFNRWTIQAGSFSKKENAIALMEIIHKQGLPATVDTTNGPNNTVLYRLRVGPTLDKKHAIEMKAKLDSQKIQSILVGE